MKKRNFFTKITEGIERILPMSLPSFILFLVILYLFYIVGRSVWLNYQSNLDIEKEENNVESMAEENDYMQYLIAYFKTDSFKEKEARSKLGYKAPGENVIALPVDQEEEKQPDSPEEDADVREANYILWWEFFFKKA